jgi:hypothetical protein
MNVNLPPVLEEARKALSLMTLDPKLNAWLKANDPMALKQIEKALLAIEENMEVL